MLLKKCVSHIYLLFRFLSKKKEFLIIICTNTILTPVKVGIKGCYTKMLFTREIIIPSFIIIIFITSCVPIATNTLRPLEQHSRQDPKMVQLIIKFFQFTR